jgi:hypothetical protein
MSQGKTGQIKVGRDRARCLTVRFSIPPVVTTREIFTSCGYRIEVLPRLLRVTGLLVQDLEVCQGISCGWRVEGVARFDVVQVTLVPRHPCTTPATPAFIAYIHVFT